MHQSFPAVPIPPPPRADPRALEFFKTNRQMSHSGDKQDVQMPRGTGKKIS